MTTEIDLNRFALALYARLRTRPGNLFFSPYSIRAALGLAQAGARGETAAEMRAILGDSPPPIADRIAKGAGGYYELASANSVWVQEGAALEREFLSMMEREAPGDFHTVDFGDVAHDVAARINEWVSRRTKNKIRNIVPPGGLTADTRLALVNAIYFKGEWIGWFDPGDTKEEPFRLAGGGEVRAGLMKRSARVRYLEGNDFQAADLSYMGDEISMLVLLPRRVDGLAELEGRLSEAMLADCVAALDYTVIDLFLPQFKLEPAPVELVEALSAVGMPSAFDRASADFSGINGLRPPDARALFLSAVLHKAFVEVDESGTVAAAATATMMLAATMSRSHVVEPPRPVFRADRPFLFAIRDRDTNALLFLGRVMDPTKTD